MASKNIVGNLMNNIDEIKEKISDDEYMNLCNLLEELNTESDNDLILCKVKYLDSDRTLSSTCDSDIFINTNYRTISSQILVKSDFYDTVTKSIAEDGHYITHSCCDHNNGIVSGMFLENSIINPILMDDCVTEVIVHYIYHYIVTKIEIIKKF